MEPWQTFNGQQYLNLETYRRSGEGVQTPVWFVQQGGTLYVRTIAGSGKVKRVRRDGRVRVAPCTVNGSLLGDWIEARASLISDPQLDRTVDRLLGRKYGLIKTLFGLAAIFQRRENAVIEIRPAVPA